MPLVTPVPADPRAFVAALHAGDPARAIQIAEAMLAARTPLGAQWHGVARFAAAEAEWPVALAAIARYVEDAPQALDRRLAAAAMQADAGRVDAAVASVTPLVAARPNDAGLRHFLGVSLLEIGQRDAGVEQLRAAIRARPASGQSWLALANALRFRHGDADFLALDAAGAAMAAGDRAEHAAWLYARGKAWDDLGEHDRAFADIARGARLVAAQRPYDADRDRRDAADLLAEGRRLRATASPAPPRAIFVTGKPRSGTTLIDTILESHSAVVGGGELNLIPLAAARVRGTAGDIAGALRARYERLLALRFGERGRILDKSLNTGRWAGHLRAALPDAPVIWIERDPLDTAWSSFRTHFNRGLGWSFDLVAMGRYHAIEDWLRAAWRTDYGPRLLTVDYAALVDDSGPTIDRLVAHAGLVPEPQVHRFHEQAGAVRTASVAQVRRPINRAGLGVAEPYRRHLAPYERAYEEARRSLGLS